MTDLSMGFIGGGRVTRFMLGGLARAGALPSSVVVSDTDGPTLERLKREYPSVAVAGGDNTVPAAQDVVFLALHQPVVPTVLGEVAPRFRPTAILVSLAPKLTLARLSELAGGFRRVARMIPNAPSLIGEGFNPMSFSEALSQAETARLSRLFSAWGDCPVVPEANLEAYAVVTAMGPTYFWFQWRALSELGRSFGLGDGELADAMTKMVTGAVNTLYRSGLPADEVEDLVPVRPLADHQELVAGAFRSKLEPLFAKLKP